jgi:hypothetical protein
MRRFNTITSLRPNKNKKEIHVLHQKLTVTVLLVGLTIFSSASNSRSYRYYDERNDPDIYSVELIGSYGQIETGDSTTKTKVAVISAEIYFDDIDTRGKPLAYAAFLNKKSSLSFFYWKADTDIEIFNAVETIEDTNAGIGFNFISEEANYILGFNYASGDTSDNEDTDVAESDLLSVNIGKYIDDSSAIEFVYTQSTTDFIGTTFVSNNEITTDTATLSYENLLDFGGDKFLFFGISASQIKNDGLGGVEETNQEFELMAEVFFNQETSLFASAEINSGDDLSSEGRTISAGGTYFITTKFAVNVILSQFASDEELVEDETSAFISGIARF